MSEYDPDTPCLDRTENLSPFAGGESRSARGALKRDSLELVSAKVTLRPSGPSASAAPGTDVGARMSKTLEQRRGPTPVAETLRAAGLTQAGVAKTLGVSHTWVSLVLNGHAPAPASFRDGVARMLGTTADHLSWPTPATPHPHPAKAHLMMAGISQRQLGASIGLHITTLSAVLNGRREPPERLVAEVERCLGVPRELLFQAPDGGSA